MVKVRILGGGLEIGKNALEIEHEGRSILLDYGASFNGSIDFPLPINIKKLEGIICSHAHLDHTAGLPLIYSSSIRPSLIMSEISLELTILLLLDFIKISKGRLQFDSTSIESLNEKAITKGPKSEFSLGDFNVKTYNAGHIPGSWVIFVEIKGKRILYTGDINVYDSRLLKGADFINESVDLMICESTYACVNHIRREMLEAALIEKIIETLERGGSVLIPSFSIGRSQEILCILEKLNLGYPIYLDGMARSASSIMLKYPEYFNDFELLKRAHEKIRWINSKKDRKEVMKEPSVIISPAGMLKGGAAIYYLEKIAKDPKSSILFVGYLAKDTPGREMLETRTYTSEKGKEKIEAEVDWFGISSHADMKGLLNYIKAHNPSKLLLIHGEYPRMAEMAKLIRKELGIECLLPNNGEEIEV